MENFNSKQEFRELFLKLIKPLKVHYSDGKAELNIGATTAGYGNKIARMEGFSRVLWGLASYLAGGGEENEMLEIYLEGLKNGTDKKSVEYWGNLHNKDQRMVEMAAISYSILLIPDKIWEPLSEESKKNLAAWLYQINDYTQAENNWQYFNVITNLALKSVGAKHSPERMKQAMDKYESFYIGNGWYSDGKRPQKDYYTAFGIHFYCLLYAKFMEKEDAQRCQLFKDRAAEFAKDFIYWFDDEGRGLPFGRSLTYRFAQSAFWSACIFAGVEPFSMGIMKGIIQRNFKYWFSQPILDNGGVLTLGYAYPNMNMNEEYNSSSSPYWAFKSFIILALSDNHKFWSAEAEPLPELENLKYIPECNMIIQRRKGDVTALTAGQYAVLEPTHTAEKYSKFAYSTMFGFSVPRSYIKKEEAAADSMLSFEVDGMIWVRRKCSEVKFENNTIYSKWVPLKGIEVETLIIPLENGHIRKHKVTSDIECIAYDSGFSYPYSMEFTEVVQEKGICRIADKNGESSVYSQIGDGCFINASPNTNLIFPKTGIPAILYKINKGINEFETKIETKILNSNIDIEGF